MSFNMMKKDGLDARSIIMLVVIAILIIIIGFLVYLYYFGDNVPWLARKNPSETPGVTETPEPTATEEPAPTPYPVNKEGNTIKERFPVPQGYERVPVEPGSFAEFLRNHPLKNYGVPAYTYEGIINEEASIQGVFNQDITPRDLQQCADAIMRLWAEYLYEREEYGRISFNFLSGFECDYVSWASGKRVKIDGNEVSWVETDAGEDYSYETFRKYLDMVHAYANTTSLQMQMTPVQVNQLSIGDVFIMTAQQMSNDYGHAAIIVDMAVHKETGEKIFLVAEGNMPATETYIVLNDDEMMGAWHKLNNNFEFVKNEWVCPAQFIRRFG